MEPSEQYKCVKWNKYITADITARLQQSGDCQCTREVIFIFKNILQANKHMFWQIWPINHHFGFCRLY